MLIIAIAGTLTQANAQKMSDKDVPPAVTGAFSKTHASTDGVEWRRDGTNYVAEHKMDKLNWMHTYDSAGMLVESRGDIAVNTLPPLALDYVNSHCTAEDVKEASRITDAYGEVSYEARVKGKHLIFDSNGNLIRTVEH